MPSKKNQGQVVFEYFILLFVAAVVLIIAFQPKGFIASGLNEKVIISDHELDEYARCVRFCGNSPCPPMCPNGCCEPGENETNCQVDCAGCVPIKCNFKNCGVIPDGCGQFIECEPCGCDKQTLAIGSEMYAIYPRKKSGETVRLSCPKGYEGAPQRKCYLGKWEELKRDCQPISSLGDR